MKASFVTFFLFKKREGGKESYLHSFLITEFIDSNKEEAHYGMFVCVYVYVCVGGGLG